MRQDNQRLCRDFSAQHAKATVYRPPAAEAAAKTVPAAEAATEAVPAAEAATKTVLAAEAPPSTPAGTNRIYCLKPDRLYGTLY